MFFDFKKINKKIAKLEKYTRYSLFLILIGFAIRLIISITSTPSGDACWHLSASKFIAENFAIPLFEPIGRTVFWAPPLFHIMTAISYSLFNSLLGEISLLLISPIFGTLFLFYSFLFIKRLFNTKTAFYSTLFLTFIPQHLYLSSIAYVDVTLAFFAIASIYYMFEKKLLISSILFGLALLTKTNAFFVIPVLVYIIHKKYSKEFIRKLFFFLLISFAIGSIWYVRNWIFLENPIWPYMNNIFNGYQDESSTVLNLNVDVINQPITFYLSMFGVPNGNLNNLLILNNPFMLLAWFLVTLFFFSFFFIGLSQIKKNTNFKIINILFISFMIFQVFISLSINVFVVRLIMPALIFFSLYWALGIEKIFKYSNILKNTIIFFLLISITVFISGELIKSSTANNMWKIYDDDFDWIKKNTPENSIFLKPPGQCYSYKFDRYTLPLSFFEFKNKTALEDYMMYNVSYIFYPDFPGESFIIGKFDTDLTLIENSTLVYNNDKTQIKIYKINYESL